MVRYSRAKDALVGDFIQHKGRPTRIIKVEYFDDMCVFTLVGGHKVGFKETDKLSLDDYGDNERDEE